MGISKFHNFVGIITESFRVDSDAIEELRIILEHEHQRVVSHNEAEAFGRSLITIVETLANGRTIVADDEEIL